MIKESIVGGWKENDEDTYIAYISEVAQNSRERERERERERRAATDREGADSEKIR